MDKKALKTELLPLANKSFRGRYVRKNRVSSYMDAVTSYMDTFTDSKIKASQDALVTIYGPTDTLVFKANKIYYLKPGTYTLAATLTVPDNCIIKGTGASTILSLEGATTCVTFSGDGSLMSDLKLLGSSTASSIAIALSGDNNKIENLTIDLYPEGIVVTGSGNEINAVISNATTCGITIAAEPETETATATANIVKESKFTENVVGVYVDSSFNQILNSTFIDNTTGIELAATSSGVCNTVIGNSIIRGTGAAQDYGVGDNTIVVAGNNNMILSNAVHGKDVLITGTGNINNVTIS